ncbi:MAG: transposase [Candidatus Altimarinota bacterium]
MARTRISPEIKEQILHRIRTEGVSAADAAREHGVSLPTVYAWLRRSTVMPSNILQINKLKRENEELKRLLGEAMLMNERSKKNRAHHAF